MFDCHCDLLTYIYINRNNIKEIKKMCNSIYNENNIKGAIFNLFFMSQQEMKEELGINKNEINVIKMLEIVSSIMQKNTILLKNIKYIYGIEGLDYLEKISDIDILYKLGVRSVNIVWNNKNKFGGGIRAEKEIGLTNLGEELVEKLVNKNIAIDLSHANEKTFYDIVEKAKQLKKKGNEPKIFASHSNSKYIYNVKRNLTDEQIIKIKELDGIIGIVEYKGFVCNEKENYIEYYLKHINYLKNLLNGVENIALSTDDEIYYNKVIEKANLFNSKNVRRKYKKHIIKQWI